MRQQVWDVATGNTTIDWPEHNTSPGQACEQLGYHREIVIQTGAISLVVYQWPQGTLGEGAHLSNERRYLLVLSLAVGYEIIGARDLKGLLLALKSLEPLIHVIGAPGGDAPPDPMPVG
ncbi:MAG: hypothetical protein H0X24_07530 [Ktedonobacterales bacterium]|nr:hypothetical protein [Ktedonobacterales bacterium]